MSFNCRRGKTVRNAVGRFTYLHVYEFAVQVSVRAISSRRLFSSVYSSISSCFLNGCCEVVDQTDKSLGQVSTNHSGLLSLTC